MHDDLFVPRRAGKDTVQILADLQAAFPEAATPQHAALHDLLGATNERITGTAIGLLAAGDAQGLGMSNLQTLMMVNSRVDCCVSVAGSAVRRLDAHACLLIFVIACGVAVQAP